MYLQSHFGLDSLSKMAVTPGGGSAEQCNTSMALLVVLVVLSLFTRGGRFGYWVSTGAAVAVTKLGSGGRCSGAVAVPVCQSACWLESVAAWGWW
jgi:hypothetical protein